MSANDPFEFSPARLIDSKYMVAEDFGHDGVPMKPRVTIDRVMKETTGRKWPLLVFKEKWAKPLKINATSREALSLMFSRDDFRVWQGKRLDLCVVRGNFPKGKKTAVRIWGSPDINRTFTFEVQQFGSSAMDRYTIEPTGKNVVLGPGLVRFGKQGGHWGKPFEEFAPEQLRELADNAEQQLKNTDVLAKMTPAMKEDLESNVREIRAYLEETQPHAEEPPEEPERGEELPV